MLVDTAQWKCKHGAEVRIAMQQETEHLQERSEQACLDSSNNTVNDSIGLAKASPRASKYEGNCDF
jgi:hypothetical protein